MKRNMIWEQLRCSCSLFLLVRFMGLFRGTRTAYNHGMEVGRVRRMSIVMSAIVGSLVFIPLVPVVSKSAVTGTVVQTIQSDLTAQDTSFTVPLDLNQTTSLVGQVLTKDAYIDQLRSNISYLSNGTSTVVHVDWLQSAAQSAALNNEVKRVEGSILKPGMSALDKEYQIHHYLVTHVKYDTTYQKYTPFDAMQGSAVCQGIATLAYQMLTRAGIPTKLVSGTADGQAHLWDEVDIEGKWYQLDVTWDDPIGRPNGEVSYLYYNLTTSQMAATHHWNHAGLPLANTDFVSQMTSNPQFVHDAVTHVLLRQPDILSEESPKVDANTLQTALQNGINQRKSSILLQYHGTMTEAQSALNALADHSLRGFTSLSYTLSGDRNPGYETISVSVQYT